MSNRKINTEGNLAKSSILTLTKTTASYMAFFNDFMKKQFLPHFWITRWEGFQRHLLYDVMKFDWLIWQCDFSATYGCAGQDGATCTQPNNVIQEVFIVSFLEEYTNEDDEAEYYRVLSESWHFFGEVNKASCPSNFVFHNICVRHLKEHYLVITRAI